MKTNIFSPSRHSAFKMLLDYTKKGVWSDKVLDSGYYLSGLESRDRALAINIFTGVIQNQRYLDYITGLYSNRTADSIDINALLLIRMAVYQMLFLDRVPNSAAVNESVSLCNTYCSGAKSFVNAVLRNIASASVSVDLNRFSDYASFLAVRYSCEDWFAAYLINRFGIDKTELFLQESVKPPKLSIQINKCRISEYDFIELLNKNGIDYNVSPLLEGSFSVSGVRVSSIPGYNEGFFYIQDDSSRFCSIVADCKPGETVLDCCASPGGKSFAAAISAGDSLKITSCDINEKKVSLVREGAERLKLHSIDCAVKDAKVYDNSFDSQFDCVFCDVPCSGMGVIRKKPEIKYKKHAEIERLPDIQSNIIKNISRYVKLGGRLIYSTCTVLKEENEDVVSALVESGRYITKDFNFNGIESSDGMYTFLPGQNDTDGFFVANLIRIK